MQYFEDDELFDLGKELQAVAAFEASGSQGNGSQGKGSQGGRGRGGGSGE